MEKKIKFDSNGFITMKTPIGDVSIVLPDAMDGTQFVLGTEYDEKTGLVEKIALNFKEEEDETESE